jgi:hypothetical protein
LVGLPIDKLASADQRDQTIGGPWQNGQRFVRHPRLACEEYRSSHELGDLKPMGFAPNHHMIG